MRDEILRLVGRVIVSLLLMAFIISSTSNAAASEVSSDKTKDNQSNASEAVPTAEPGSVQRPAGSGRLQVAYVLYNDALRERPESASAGADALSELPAGAVNLNTGGTKAMPAPAPHPAVSTAPMTAGEKLEAYARRTFLSPGSYAQSVFSGLFNELRDKKDKPDFDTGDYFGDSMTRAARSHAFRITSGFFEKFAYPTIFKQDPRYHRSPHQGAGAKVGYAVSRLFVTQGDRSGDQVNASYLLGAATASAIANAWEREDRRDLNHSLRRFGVHLGLTAFSNILREFIGGQ